MPIVSSNESRVQWLLDFAYRDLKSMSPGDLLNLREDVKAFFGGAQNRAYRDPPAIVAGAINEFLDTADARWFGRLQARARALLGPRFAPHDWSKPQALPLPVGITPRFGFAVAGVKGWSVLMLTTKNGKAAAESAVLFVLMLALALTNSGDRIQLCPSCKERLFWRARRQKYCSSKCRARES